MQFEAVRSEAGLNRFVMTPTKWIEQTNTIGIVSKAGRCTCNITSNAGFWSESDLCGGRNRFIQRCREAYDIYSVSSGTD